MDAHRGDPDPDLSAPEAPSLDLKQPLRQGVVPAGIRAHLLLPVRPWPGQNSRRLSSSREGSNSETPVTGLGGLSGWNPALGLQKRHATPIPSSHAAFWAARVVVGAGRSPSLSHAFPRGPGAPSSSQVSLSPSRYKAWESQPREIRSQFQPVPTERSYQDGTCRMEYFKLYLSPDRGRLIAAPSQGMRGEGPAAR